MLYTMEKDGFDLYHLNIVYTLIQPNLQMTEKQLQLEILKRDKQIQELYVLIDTLQTNLRAATSQLDETTKEKITSVQSYKWCMNWRAGDETN